MEGSTHIYTWKVAKQVGWISHLCWGEGEQVSCAEVLDEVDVKRKRKVLSEGEVKRKRKVVAHPARFE